MRETNSRLTADLLCERAISSISDADRLPGPRVAARRDAGEHPLEHHVGERITRREVRVGPQLDLALAVGAASPRTADRHAPAAERDLAVLMAVAHRRPARDVLALRADDLVDLGLHQLVQHAEPDADAQREQSLLRRTGELAQRLLHRRRQPLDALCGLAATDAADTVLMAVPPVLKKQRILRDVARVRRPCAISRAPDHDQVNVFLNRVADDLYPEIARRFDPTIDDSELPGTADNFAEFQVIPTWREIAWRNAERLVSAPSAEARARVAAEIEAYAASQAETLRASYQYGLLGSSAARDAYCAAHHDDP